jgi:hypothetical protein
MDRECNPGAMQININKYLSVQFYVDRIGAMEFVTYEMQDNAFIIPLRNLDGSWDGGC